MSSEIMLVDLSSLAHPIWHMAQSDPDPNKASTQIVARVRALSANHPATAIACDSGRSFRKDISDTYKANRPQAEATLHHQIDLAREQLAADGFPIWAVKGFEADDLIASAVARTLEVQDATALIVSADKDLLALVGPRVRAMSPTDGTVYDADAVKAKFGVRPDQIRDYLTLVGDASDNIRGANQIGPKKAAALLADFNTLEGVYAALDQHATKFKPATATSLREFQANLVTTRALVTLRTDVEIPFEEIAAERVPKEVQTFAFDIEDDDESTLTPAQLPPAAATVPPPQPPAPAPVQASVSAPADSTLQPTSIALREPEVLAPAPAEWERQLDPRSMKDARALATDMFSSRLFSAYGTPAAILSTVMLGRELGLPAMASLRGVHIIEGRHTLSAQTMVALILKSGLAEYFRPVSFSDIEATYETLRKGPGNQPIRLSHTLEMAKTAGLVKEKSNWVKSPTDMCVARASSRLARMVYPDIVGGLYTPDEIDELRGLVA